MFQKWDDAREKKLLLKIISVANPTIERGVWDAIAAGMGGGLTGDACRQKFQGIKRSQKAVYDDPTSTTSTPSKPTKPSNHKTSTSASGTPATARKRKAADADLDPDDDEATLFTPKAAKLKKEASAHATGAEVFKAEEDGTGVDLENDDLYDDDDDDDDAA